MEADYYCCVYFHDRKYQISYSSYRTRPKLFGIGVHFFYIPYHCDIDYVMQNIAIALINFKSIRNSYIQICFDESVFSKRNINIRFFFAKNSVLDYLDIVAHLQAIRIIFFDVKRLLETS